MSKIDDGGPAFPSRPPMARVTSTEPYNVELVRSGFDGMSLRDWFAGQALAGLCACPGATINEFSIRKIWEAADVMLAARKEREKS